jgi:hypothetical protein
MRFIRNYKKEQIKLSNKYEVLNKRSLKPVKHKPKLEVISFPELDALIDYLEYCILHNIEPILEPMIDITDIIHSISPDGNRIIYRS